MPLPLSRISTVHAPATVVGGGGGVKQKHLPMIPSCTLSWLIIAEGAFMDGVMKMAPLLISNCFFLVGGCC